jgi:hypothetical protein
MLSKSGYSYQLLNGRIFEKSIRRGMKNARKRRQLKANSPGGTRRGGSPLRSAAIAGPALIQEAKIVPPAGGRVFLTMNLAHGNFTARLILWRLFENKWRPGYE